MFRRVKRKLKNSIFLIRQILQLDRTLVLQGQVRAEQILARGKLEKLSDAGFGVFAQTDEDGILSWLVDRIGCKHETFIEFGVHDYRESNTRYLLLTRNWCGLVMDGDEKNIEAIHSDDVGYMRDLLAVPAFITRDNIADLIRSADFSERVGILSVDIDGVDYWVLERIEIEADIIVVEYNDFLGDVPVTVPYSPSFSRWLASPHATYWGASLAAFRHLLEGRGYVFVGTNLIGINAFFVHSDHADSIKEHLESVVIHPCTTRDARDSSGRISFQPYRAFAAEVADKPLIRVDTGETIKLGDVCRRWRASCIDKNPAVR